jgi:hypothetical protein
MFEASFTQEIMALGQRDAMAQREELMEFLCAEQLTNTIKLPVMMP